MAFEDTEIDIFAASKIGSFKHIKYFKDITKNTKKCIENLQDVKELEKGDEVTCLSWCKPDQKQLLLGRRRNIVQTYCTENKQFIKSVNVDHGKGYLVSVGKCKNRLVTGLSCGAVRVWSNKSESFDVNAGGEIDHVRFCTDDGTVFATGGKENDVKLWRIGESVPLFHAKNLAHDWLELRRPVWVSDLCIMPNTDAKLIAACSRYGYVRLYDTRAQRRPVCNVEFDKMAATCIAHTKRDRMLLVGFGRGQLQQVDLRSKPGRPDKLYKGSVGAVTDISAVNDYIVSVSLDRHLKIHHADTKELLYKQYLTSKLTSVLVQTERRTRLDTTSDDQTVPDKVQLNDDDGADGLDEMFDSMEPISDKQIKQPCSDDEDIDSKIRKLVRSTEKRKLKMSEAKRKKRMKSVFYNA